MRQIIEANALDWMAKNRDVGSIITSLPDLDEIPFMDVKGYALWLAEAAEQCLKTASKGHPIIFYQTDRMINGRRLSKAYILMEVASAWDFELIWHKIVLRRDPGKTDLRRPGYSHLLCFGDKKVRPGRPTPDVLHSGGVLYPNGMGITAATVALQAAKQHGDRLCDPFCGRGTVPALAEHMGFAKIIGVDIDPQQVVAARQLRLFKGESKRERL